MRRIAGFGLLSCLTFICILSMTGCTRESISDLEKVAQKQSEQQMAMYEEKVIKEEFQPLNNKVEFVKKGDAGYVETSRKGNKFSMTVIGTELSDNINGLQNILGNEGLNDVISWYRKMDTDGEINDDGYISNDNYGISRRFIAAKLLITNNSDADIRFNASNLSIFNIRTSEGGKEYIRLGDFSIIDKSDSKEVNRGVMTLKPNESREVVLVTVIRDEIIKEYKRSWDGTKNIYSDVATYGSSLDSLYIQYTTTQFFTDGSKVFELKVDKKR